MIILASSRTWLYQYPGRRRPWVAGNTLCYTKAFWRRHPFADLDVGEDARFVWSEAQARPLALADHTLIVALIHARNVDPKRVHQRCWHPQPTEAVGAVMGADLEAYRQAALAAAPGGPSRPR